MSYANHLVGRSFGRLGVVVVQPAAGTIAGYASEHALNRAIQRDITTAERLDVVRNPIVVLAQRNGGQHLFLNERGVVVLTADGLVVTTYGESDFGGDIQSLLAAARA